MAEQTVTDSNAISPTAATPRKNDAARDRTISRIHQMTLIIVRLALAYLFFTQLWWKLPPTFGCPEDFAFTTGQVNERGFARPDRTSGLCDWLGLQAVYAERELLLFQANLDNTGGPEIFLNLSGIRQLNGSIVENVIMPNIQFMGWILWLTELAVVVLVGLGLFSRLGGLLALAVSLQLTIGLAAIPNPVEWEWIYLQMVFLSLVVLGTAPGRFFGLDALLVPRLQRLIDNGKQARLAQFGLLLTGK